MASRSFLFFFGAVALFAITTGNAARCNSEEPHETPAKLLTLHNIERALQKGVRMSRAVVFAWTAFREKPKKAQCKTSGPGFCCKVCRGENKRKGEISVFCSVTWLLHKNKYSLLKNAHK